MTRPELLKILLYVQEAYQREVGEGTAEIWWEEVGQLSAEDVMSAVRAHVRESFFPPTVANVVQAIEGVRPTRTAEDERVLAEGRRLAKGTIDVFGEDRARQIIGDARWKELFGTKREVVPGLEEVIERELESS